MKHKQLIILSSLIVLLASSPMALATNTWYVNGVSGSDTNGCTAPTSACKTIGHAISLASSGDSIMVAAALYKENLIIGISLEIIGSGAETTIIDGGGVNRVVLVAAATNVTLSKVTIQNGLGVGINGPGAGVSNGGTLKIIASTISGNRATTGSLTRFGFARGGGIANGGTLTIINSTISGNSATTGCTAGCLAWGGGIFNVGTLTIINSTLSGNSSSGTGGAIYNGGSVSLTSINNSTLSGNSAVAIYNYTGYKVVLQNSIVANSPNGPNCFGTMTSIGYNLSNDSTCNFNSPGDLNNHDPNLGTLGYNGGPTQTMALLSGSPAIDGGNPSGCTDGQGNLLKTDQRGMPRPDSEDKGGCDIGAYEGQSGASIGPLEVAVPNVVGDTQAAATAAITGAGLVVGTVTHQSSSTVAAGDVISESPAAGTNVATSSAVNLVVSTPSGPSPLLAPSSLSFGNVLAGTISAPQSATLTNVGNAPLTILSMRYNDNAPGGFWDVLNTTTCAPNLTIAPGSSCTFSIAFEANANGSGPQPGSVIMNFAAGGSATLQLSANVIP